MRPTDNRFRPRHCQGDHLAAVARSASSVLREHHTSAEVVPSLDGPTTLMIMPVRLS